MVYLSKAANWSKNQDHFKLAKKQGHESPQQMTLALVLTLRWVVAGVLVFVAAGTVLYLMGQSPWIGGIFLDQMQAFDVFCTGLVARFV